jgi:hypothetical protein
MEQLELEAPELDAEPEIEFKDVHLWVFTEATLEQLNSLSEAIQMRRKNLGIQKGLSFKPGDPVWFDAGSRGIIKGTFVKQMQKNAKVKSETGTNWTVAPALLKAGAP